MPESAPTLPGRLGDPSLTLATDPRLDRRLATIMAGDEEALEAPPVGPDSSVADVLAFIDGLEIEMDAVYAGQARDLPPVKGVTHRTEVIQGVDGNEIRLYIEEPTEETGPRPAILHFHGGGMVMFSASNPGLARWRHSLAATGMSVIGVEFRNAAGALGPYPFPAGLNDCASATQWAHENKEALGISHIVVSGESGGGNLCLATALKAKQEGWIDQIAGVYAGCPFIVGTYSPILPELTSWHENDGYQLDSGLCHALSKAYDPDQKHTTNPLAWPYQATPEDLAGLPPHTISTNELDPLRDEGNRYARKLQAAGVSVASRTVNGTYHAGDQDCEIIAPEVYFGTVRDVFGFASALR